MYTSFHTLPLNDALPISGYRPMDSAVPYACRHAPGGAILESSPASATIAYALALRLAKQGGAAIIIDYGYEGPALGDTLQAVRGHQAANPFADPGESDQIGRAHV